MLRLLVLFYASIGTTTTGITTCDAFNNKRGILTTSGDPLPRLKEPGRPFNPSSALFSPPHPALLSHCKPQAFIRVSIRPFHPNEPGFGRSEVGDTSVPDTMEGCRPLSPSLP